MIKAQKTITLKKYKEKNDISNIDWVYISRYQKLSEDFIREFKDKLDWNYISRCQKLSDDFIREFKDYINKNNLVYNSVFHCGKSNRCISIKKSNPEIIKIGCFKGTEEEAIEAVSKKYEDIEEARDYISKIKQCFKGEKKCL